MCIVVYEKLYKSEQKELIIKEKQQNETEE